MDVNIANAVELFFQNATFAQVFYEVIANALDAGATEIDVVVTANDIKGEHLSVRVADNGDGFTDERFERFRVLLKPADADHKGLGRLVYLKNFGTVDIVSVYGNKKRTFRFSYSFDGKSKVTPATDDDTPGTILVFKHFRRARLRSFDDVKPGVLKERVLEQFLPRLNDMRLAGIKFAIRFDLRVEGESEKLVPSRETLCPADVPPFKTKLVEDVGLDQLVLDNLGVDLTKPVSISYFVREATQPRLFTAASVDGRSVPIDLGNVSKAAVPDGYMAVFLFESPLFSGRSDSSRQKLVLDEQVSQRKLFAKLREAMAEALCEELPVIAEQNEATRSDYEARYPHLVGLFEEHTVGLIDREEAIKEAQGRYFRKQRQVLDSSTLDDHTFETSVEISSRALTEYILYRDNIIRRLAEVTHSDDESVVHNLIVPRYNRFERGSFPDGLYQNNAWILDDRFMRFRTVLSEAREGEVIRAIRLDDDPVAASGRPDIALIFSADPDDDTKVEVVIVELKRRHANEKENFYIIAQLSARARLLVKHCSNIERVWYFGIIDIDPAFEDLLVSQGWTPLFSNGKVFYNEVQVKNPAGTMVPTPTYLMSYDAVIEDAKARNHTFLEILKNEFRSRDRQPEDETKPTT